MDSYSGYPSVNSKQCLSCHDVHLSRNTKEYQGCRLIYQDGLEKIVFLSLCKSSAGSSLCLTCHKR
ncbi:MAG: hypothetical protein KQI35_06250 [Bacteroidetes bacterium]|nr:hypothetical protein [Bacteroidota bacterium]